MLELPSCHFSMMKNLGATFDPHNMNPSFSNPAKPDEKVYVILDVCHMLKLVRNTLASCGIIVDADGNKIMWQYIEELHKLQDKEGLHLGNKLKKAHINWKSQKMKVNLASQTLSASVASALRLKLVTCYFINLNVMITLPLQ